MISSFLTLAVMIVMVATMRPMGGRHQSRRAPPTRPQARRPDTLILGRGVKLGPATVDPKDPGKVSYELMRGNKLPTATQRALRRVSRPFGRVSLWVHRRFNKSAPLDIAQRERRPQGESVELQNFLEARNREIARRKAEDPSKRGPEDTIH